MILVSLYSLSLKMLLHPLNIVPDDVEIFLLAIKVKNYSETTLKEKQTQLRGWNTVLILCRLVALSSWLSASRVASRDAVWASEHALVAYVA